MEPRPDRRTSLPSDLRHVGGRAGVARHSADSKERKATASEEAEAIRSAKQLHVHQPGIVFVPGAKLQVRETIDNNWYDCKVVEVDWGELDILVHYQRWSDRFDEWLKMDSPRIRAVPAPRGPDRCPYSVGESVVALWPVDQRYYPATVTRVISAHQCEVKFRDDNITKVLRCAHLSKSNGKEPALPLPPSPAVTASATPTSSVPGAAKKNIFDVNICEEKRKPKRKAEYTEMLEGMHKRRSLQGLMSTRSSRHTSDKQASATSLRASLGALSSAASSTFETPAAAATLPSSLPTEGAVSVASPATAVTRGSALKEGKNVSSKIAAFKKTMPEADLSSSRDKLFHSEATANDAENTANEGPSSVSDPHWSSQPATDVLSLPERETPSLPESAEAKPSLETPRRTTSARPVSLQLESHTPKSTKPVSTPVSKLSVKKNKTGKVSSSSKPSSLLATLSATRRAPMADDCMLSWEKHGCNVVNENAFPGWKKQYSRRLPYTGQDSWDVAYYAPDGSVLRNKRDLSAYAETNTLPSLVASFDFTAAGVQDAMLEHMKVCSVGTTKIGMSRTVELPSSSATPTPTLPSSPIKTRSSGMPQKKSDVLTPEISTSSKSFPASRSKDPETSSTSKDEAQDDSEKDLALPPPPPPPLRGLPAAERKTLATCGTVSAVVSAGVDASHAATAAVLQEEEHETGVCSGDSDEENDQDVLSPQSQPNNATQTKVAEDGPRSSTPALEGPKKSGQVAPPGRFKIEIPIVLGRDPVEVQEPVAKPPSADAKPTPSVRPRLGATRREAKFAESPSMSLEEHVCVVKNCNKTFRKHSLLQMHLKHYHPGYDRLGYAPNVADLAYARTALGLLEPGKTSSIERRRKRHSLAFPPDTKRRKVEAAGRRKSAATLDMVEESDIGFMDTDSVDARRADAAQDSDWTADQESLAGDTSSLMGLADQKFSVLDSDSEDGSDFVGFPSVGQKKGSSPPQQLPLADGVEQSASADDGSSEETDDEATDVADEGGEEEEEDDGAGHRHIINCGCGSTEEDGLMLQCDVCMCWQHAQCYAIGKKAVPEKYVCSMCTNPELVRSNHRYDHQVRNWLKEGAIPKFSFSSDDVSGTTQLEASVQRGHELSGALLQHSHLLHALGVLLAIAKKPDHPKLVMWHKKWSDPRPPGFVPSILPLTPPPTSLQPFLPQVSGPLFPHSSSLTKDEAALIRDIIDMEPLIQTDPVFGGVSSLLPDSDSACLMATPSSALNSSEVLSSSSSLILPRPPAPLTFGPPCETAFSTVSIPTPLLSSAPFESSASCSLSTVNSASISTLNVTVTASADVSIANSFSATSDASTCTSFTTTDKLLPLPIISSSSLHTSNSNSTSYHNSAPLIETKLPTIPSSCDTAEKVVQETSSLNSITDGRSTPEINTKSSNLSSTCDTSKAVTLVTSTLITHSDPSSLTPIPERVLDPSAIISAVAEAVPAPTENSLSKCTPVSVPDVVQSDQPTTTITNPEGSGTSNADVLSEKLVSNSTSSGTVPDGNDIYRGPSTRNPHLSLALDKDSDVSNSQETILKEKNSEMLDEERENIPDTRLHVQNSDNVKIGEEATEKKLCSTINKVDVPLETEKLKCENTKYASEIDPSEEKMFKESLETNSRTLCEHEMKEKKSVDANINEKESNLSTLAKCESESLKGTPEKESNFDFSKEGQSPDKKEVSFDLHLNLSSSTKGENSIIDEEVEQKSFKMLSLDLRAPEADETGDEPLPSATPVSSEGETERDQAIVSGETSVHETTKLSIPLTKISAATDSSAASSFQGTFDSIDPNSVPTVLKSESHTEAPLISVPNSNDEELPPTCSTLPHDLNYASNPETANTNSNPEAAGGADGTENLYLGDNADLDTSDLALDLNELLMGNAAPSLEQFGIPNLAPGQATHDVPGPSVPFPEAERIEPVKCKLNLLSHVQAAQDTLERAYDLIELQIRKLEEQVGLKDTKDEDSLSSDTTTRQLVQMVLADMNIVERLSLYTG